MLDLTIADRYASALVELGQETGKVETFSDELGRFVAACENAPELAKALAHPGFSADERMNVLNAVLGGLEMDTVTANFLRVVLEKGRFKALPAIVTAYDQKADRLAGRVRAQVRTAVPLTTETEVEVRQLLEKLTGKTVVIEPSVDPEILGGMIAHVDGQIYDASLRARLQRVRQDLLSSNPDLASQA